MWPKQFTFSPENVLPADNKIMTQTGKMIAVVLMKQVKEFHEIVINKSVTFGLDSRN